MITNDNTRRALQALRHNDRDFFHSDLDDYLIECLESLEMTPTASDAVFLKREISHVFNFTPLAEQEEEVLTIIDDFFDIEEEPEEEPEEEEESGYPDKHINLIGIVFFILSILVFTEVAL